MQVGKITCVSSLKILSTLVLLQSTHFASLGDKFLLGYGILKCYLRK